MDNTLVTQSFYMSLVKFLLHAKQEVINCSGEFGLSSMQAMTLLLVDNDQVRSMNYFCKMYDCDASNITGIIDGLEQKGLVSRREHPADRRVKVIVLEPAGKAVKKRVMERLAENSAVLFEGLNKKELSGFMTIVEKLAVHQDYTPQIS